MSENNSVRPETAIKIAWDNFQLLAQQRMTHFNFFIVIMCAIGATYANHVNKSLRGNIIAFVLSTAELITCYVFCKFDSRNKFLIKNTEKAIKQIEKNYEDWVPKLFTKEEKDTKIQRIKDEKTCWFFRQHSTSQLYKWYYCFFFILGLLALALSFCLIGKSVNLQIIMC